jgi:hypothetical protein
MTHLIMLPTSLNPKIIGTLISNIPDNETHIRLKMKDLNMNEEDRSLYEAYLILFAAAISKVEHIQAVSLFGIDLSKIEHDVRIKFVNALTNKHGLLIDFSNAGLLNIYDEAEIFTLMLEVSNSTDIIGMTEEEFTELLECIPSTINFIKITDSKKIDIGDGTALPLPKNQIIPIARYIAYQLMAFVHVRLQSTDKNNMIDLSFLNTSTMIDDETRVYQVIDELLPLRLYLSQFVIALLLDKSIKIDTDTTRNDTQRYDSLRLHAAATHYTNILNHSIYDPLKYNSTVLLDTYSLNLLDILKKQAEFKLSVMKKNTYIDSYLIKTQTCGYKRDLLGTEERKRMFADCANYRFYKTDNIMNNNKIISKKIGSLSIHQKTQEKSEESKGILTIKNN